MRIKRDDTRWTILRSQPEELYDLGFYLTQEELNSLISAAFAIWRDFVKAFGHRDRLAVIGARQRVIALICSARTENLTSRAAQFKGMR